MKDLIQAKAIINKAKSFDDELLKRTTGLSETLSNLLKDYLPDELIQDIKSMDSLLPPKKRALLDYIEKQINQINPVKKEEKRTNIPFDEILKLKISDLKFLKPVEKRAFKKVGIQTVYEALFFFPRKYEDRRLKKLSQIKDGETGVFKLEVLETKKIKKGKLKVQVSLKQGNKILNAFFVHDRPFLFTFFRKGKEVFLYGKVSVFKNEISVIQPQIFTDFDPVIMGRIVPVYSLRGDSSVKTTSQTINHLRRGIYKLLERFLDSFFDYIPAEIRNRYKLPDIKTALKNIHFPEENNLNILNSFHSRPQIRFIFEELFILELAQAYRKQMIKENPAKTVNIPKNFIETFEEKLPFKLTDDQKKAISDILADISKPVPMNRMVQGDVGSGKTVVAIASSLAVALDNKQAAVMAPTEILAQQHFKNFKTVAQHFGIDVYLLTGSTPQKEKKVIYKKMESGEAKIVIGTHALIQDEVRFKNLALVIVDEQHRFGVEQRKALIEKSGSFPHVLVMTATPIPRTLTMALYGDLDVSIIKQLPAGRKKVSTLIYYDDEREIMYSKIGQQLEEGRQVFVVYPLIEESEKLDLKSAEEGFRQWKEAFAEYSVVMLHGKMSQEEKDNIMERFRKKEFDILVSTTVIEVGVDVPNASVMVIEDAYRFGLSQIHQLRGRVGRGQYEGYCFLVIPSKFRYVSKDPETEKKRKKVLDRLKILVSTADGFKIAEADWTLRGGGDIIGTAQSGRIMFSISDLTREKDKKVLVYAKKEADLTIKDDPHLDRHPDLKKIMFKKYGEKFNLANIA